LSATLSSPRTPNSASTFGYDGGALDAMRRRGSAPAISFGACMTAII
jgi:hypothetical protein